MQEEFRVKWSRAAESVWVGSSWSGRGAKAKLPSFPDKAPAHQLDDVETMTFKTVCEHLPVSRVVMCSCIAPRLESYRSYGYRSLKSATPPIL